MRSRLAVAQAVLVLLALPDVAKACGACLDADMYAMAPWFHVAGGVLVLWGLLNWLLKQLLGTISPQPEVTSLTITVYVIMFAALIYLFAGIGFVGVIIILSPFILFRMGREIICPQLIFPNVGRWFAVLAASAILIIAAMGISWRASLTPLEAFDRFSSTSTPAGKTRYRKLGEDPNIRPEDLLPMLTSGEPDRMSKAFLILEHRRNPDDLIALQGTILAFMPEEKPAGYVIWGDPLYHARSWLSVIGIESPDTRADVERWLYHYNQMIARRRRP